MQRRNSLGGPGDAGQELAHVISRSWRFPSEVPLCFLGLLQLSRTPIPTEPSLTQKPCFWLRLGQVPASCYKRPSLTSPLWLELTQAGL